MTDSEIQARFADVHPPFSQQESVVEANRCLYCFNAPCAAACPTHIDVPSFIKKIASGDLTGSARTILDANVLGSSCSRVCPVEVLCEGACVMHSYNKRPIEIGRLQRHAMDHFLANGASLPVGAHARTKRVACIGGGPASLACAAELRREGYPATIFDNRPLPGGLNTYGVAEYKLRQPDAVREIELIRSAGVEFRNNVTAGVDVSIAELESQFDAIFLGVGLGRTQPLGIPGEDLPHVMDALGYIAAYKSGVAKIARRVAIVGGGNTAIDAAVAARRLNALEVNLLYRRGGLDIPAFWFEFARAKGEPVSFHWHAQPAEITPEAVRCGDGREFPADLVVIAIGQSRLLELLEQCRGVSLDGGLVKVDPATGQSANPRYFAGGDCVNGGREVVDAVAAGKRAARGIVRWLT